MASEVTWVSLVTLGFTAATLWRTHHVGVIEERRRKSKEIETRLNEFYSPLLLYVRTINHLYCEIRRAEIPEVQREDYRTIRYLLEGNQFRGNEAALLKMVLEIEVKIEEVLVTKSGLVDAIDLKESWQLREELQGAFEKFEKAYAPRKFSRTADFRGALELLLVHVQMLRAIAAGEIQGEPDRFELFAYPRMLDGYLELRIKQLTEERRKLNRLGVLGLLRNAIGDGVEKGMSRGKELARDQFYL